MKSSERYVLLSAVSHALITALEVIMYISGIKDSDRYVHISTSFYALVTALEVIVSLCSSHKVRSD